MGFIQIILGEYLNTIEVSCLLKTSIIKLRLLHKEFEVSRTNLAWTQRKQQQQQAQTSIWSL